MAERWSNGFTSQEVAMLGYARPASTWEGESNSPERDGHSCLATDHSCRSSGTMEQSAERLKFGQRWADVESLALDLTNSEMLV